MSRKTAGGVRAAERDRRHPGRQADPSQRRRRRRQGAVLRHQRSRQPHRSRHDAGELPHLAARQRPLFRRHHIPRGGDGAGLRQRHSTCRPMAITSMSRSRRPGACRPSGAMRSPASSRRRMRSHSPPARTIIDVSDEGDLWIAGASEDVRPGGLRKRSLQAVADRDLHVRVSGGIPQSAEPVYVNSGREIGAGSVGATAGKNLFIGSIFDPKILECALP